MGLCKPLLTPLLAPLMRGPGDLPFAGSAPDIVAGLTQTFDYLPSRDGLALITGGPTEAGYQANLVANPTRKWTPRIASTDPIQVAKGVLDEGDSWNADPEYAWSNGFTPFSIDGNGDLVIRAKKVSTVSPAFAGGEVPTNPGTATAYTWVTGSLSSNLSFAQYGGYFEAECKVDISKAVWPAFWGLTGKTYAARAEIDIMERVGDTLGPNVYQTNNIQAESPQQDAGQIDVGSSMAAGFHKFGAYVTDQKVEYYLDRQLVRTTDVSTKPKFSDPFFLLLTNPVGTNLVGWVGHPDGTTNDPADFVVRSVKAWQRPGPVSIVPSVLGYLDDLTVGGTVATITSDFFGADSAITFSIVADPDSMFTVDNSAPVIVGQKISVPLKLAQVVLATTKASHDVTLRATDSAGRTHTRKFTFGVVTATPIQANYVTVQDLTNAYWAKNNVTASSATQVLETTGSGTHNPYASNKTRAAGVKTFTFFCEVEPVGDRYWMKLQIFSAAFGANQAIANFDLANVATDFSTNAGTWSGVAPFIIPIPGTNRIRVGMDFVTDASSTNFTASLLIQPNGATTSYVGDVTKGMKIQNIWLYNKNAGAGGS